MPRKRKQNKLYEHFDELRQLQLIAAPKDTVASRALLLLFKEREKLTDYTLISSAEASLSTEELQQRACEAILSFVDLYFHTGATAEALAQDLLQTHLLALEQAGLDNSEVVLQNHKETADDTY